MKRAGLYNFISVLFLLLSLGVIGYVVYLMVGS
jgi:hypothetical protein